LSDPIIGKEVKLGKGIHIWNFVNIGDRTKIGDNVKIGSHVDIGEDCFIGDDCNIQCHVNIPNLTTIGSGVFLAPKVCILNDLYMDGNIQPVTIKEGASIGGNATIRPGVIIGEGARIGCGSVVTKDVPPNEWWVGNPARFHKAIDNPK